MVHTKRLLITSPVIIAPVNNEAITVGYPNVVSY